VIRRLAEGDHSRTSRTLARMSVESSPDNRGLISRWLSGWRGILVAAAIVVAFLAAGAGAYVAANREPDPPASTPEKACELNVRLRMGVVDGSRFHAVHADVSGDTAVVTGTVDVGVSATRLFTCRMHSRAQGWVTDQFAFSP
jgi:hypothetical protein